MHAGAPAEAPEPGSQAGPGCWVRRRASESARAVGGPALARSCIPPLHPGGNRHHHFDETEI